MKFTWAYALLSAKIYLFRLSYIVKPFTKFFKQVTESSYNATADVYAAMFMCDFILFLVLVLFFSSFGPAVSTEYIFTSVALLTLL